MINNKIMKSSLVASTLLSGICSQNLLATECKNNQQKKPNVIFVFADQMRNSAMGFWSKPQYAKHLQGAGDPVFTPNLDKLASQGVILNRAISNYPVCSPYRAMMISGSYPEQAGVWQNCHALSDADLNNKITCMPQAFKDAGYNTSYFGKIHWERTLPVFDKNGNYVGTKKFPGGNYVNKYDTYVPPGKDRVGIEYYYHTLKDDHFKPLIYSNDPLLIGGKKDGEKYVMPKRQFSTKTELEALLSYLKNDHNQRDEQKPFFMVWSINPPHPPYDLKRNTYMPTYNKYYSPEKIPNINSLFTRKNAIPKSFPRVRSYFANVSAVDLFVGKLLNYLKENNLEKNTIVVFSADHGEMLGSHGLKSKNVPYIEAMNVPFLIRFPQKLQHRVDNLILGAPDVMPTLLGLADVKVPNSVQGANYSAQLIDANCNKESRPKYTPYYYQGSKWWAKKHSLAVRNRRGVYSGDFTLIVEAKDDKTIDKYIYNNKLDPYQLKKEPLTKYPKESKAMLNYLVNLMKKTDDPWVKNKVAADVIPY